MYEPQAEHGLMASWFFYDHCSEANFPILQWAHYFRTFAGNSQDYLSVTGKRAKNKVIPRFSVLDYMFQVFPFYIMVEV